MKKKRLIVLSVITICLVTVLYLLYYFNYIPHKKYNNENFNIKTYMSDIDKDNDGIDDQTDILINVSIIVVVILMMHMGFALMWLLLLLRMQDMI